MKVIIPLAGFGTRLRPHTYTRPKPLINVAGQPVLGHILDKFKGVDVEEFIIVYGYLGDQIMQYMECEYAHYQTRFVEQPEMLGQAHAIWLAREYVDGPVLIVFVDTIFETDLTELNDETADGVMYVKEVEDPRRFGVALAGPDGYITRFIEKPSSMTDNLAVTGLYYLKDGPALMRACQELMDRNIQTQGEFFLADVFNLMLEVGARFKVKTLDVWKDCGKPETVLDTNRYLLAHGHDNSAQTRNGNGSCIIIPPVNIHPSAELVCSVIGPNVTIGAGCHIEYSIVRDSIIDEGANICNALLEESLVGKQAQIEGRFRKFNLGDSTVVGFS
jgi:glucose-1-phosphate thymidylyltransferase